jgi:tRNA (cmo5U34)-methyltransferase
MPTPLQQKSTVAEIKARFDNDVERFSSLDTGQVSTIDAPLSMELITLAATRATPRIRRVLDVGCGAGNNTLKLLGYTGPLDCDLLDLSAPMLARASERVVAAGAGTIRTWQGDFRALDLPEGGYDVILAAAVLHHLRDDADWEAAFARLYRLLAPGGGLWITDLVAQEHEAVQALMWARYGEYLAAVGGAEYRDRVLAYVDREDSPRPVTYQLELLRRVGFAQVELLHKNSCFAAYGAVKAMA